MPGDQKRRQKALERKAAKRKRKQQEVRRQAGASTVSGSPRRVIKQAMHWPVYECLISEQWQDPHNLTEVFIARRSPDSGMIAAAAFLVDLGCLGVKNAAAFACETHADYDEVRQRVASRHRMVTISFDLAAKVIREAIAYARDLGFSPHADFSAVAPILEGSNPEAASTPVPLGVDGTPFFMAGPYDHVPTILNQLTRRMGPGNFQVVAPQVAPIEVRSPEALPDALAMDEDAAEDEDEDEPPAPPAPSAGTADPTATHTGWRRFLPRR